MPIFSADRYTAIDFVPLGVEHASSTIVFEKPSQGSLYLFDESSSVKIWYKDYYKFPFTIAVGSLTVNASVNGDFADTIDVVDFYVDGQLVFSDDSFPFSWKWDSFSAGFHTLKVDAFADGSLLSSASQEVFKLF
jgi:hypothetical protein